MSAVPQRGNLLESIMVGVYFVMIAYLFGSGYGSKILSTVASSVDSYDIKNFGFNKVIDLDSQSWDMNYDAIVSFETIEHLSRPEFFLDNVRTHSNLLIVSTPGGETRGANHFHKQVWTSATVKDMLAKRFSCWYRYQGPDTFEITEAPREIRKSFRNSVDRLAAFEEGRALPRRRGLSNSRSDGPEAAFAAAQARLLGELRRLKS
jgi:hypothetical protein